MNEQKRREEQKRAAEFKAQIESQIIAQLVEHERLQQEKLLRRKFEWIFWLVVVAGFVMVLLGIFCDEDTLVVFRNRRGAPIGKIGCIFSGVLLMGSSLIGLGRQRLRDR